MFVFFLFTGPNIVIDVHNPDSESSDEPSGLLILVICLAVLVFVILLAILSIVCAKRRKDNQEISETQSSTDCSEVGRPFMPQNYQQHHPQTLGIKNNNLIIQKVKCRKLDKYNRVQAE